MKFEQTISMLKGDSSIYQCNYCGLIAVQHHDSTGHKRLAGCPSCDKQSWTKQTLPISGFSKDDEMEADVETV